MSVRWAFFGSDAIALSALADLAAQGRPPVLVVTQPDRPSGRGQRVQAGPVAAWAHGLGIPVLQPEKPDAALEASLRDAGVELALVMAYGHILRRTLLAIPRLGFLNLHTSILPAFRGAAPVAAAIASGATETGVTLMRIVPRLDAGAVIAVERVPVGDEDTTDLVEARLGLACVPLLRRTWDAVAAGTAVEVPQDDAAATSCRKLDKADSALDWAVPARVLARRINALHPWPGAAFEHAGVRIRCGLAVACAGSGAAPGTVLGMREGALAVACADGEARLLRLQRPGGRLLPAAEFLRGFALPEGAVLPSSPMRPLVG